MYNDGTRFEVNESDRLWQQQFDIIGVCLLLGRPNVLPPLQNMGRQAQNIVHSVYCDECDGRYYI